MIQETFILEIHPFSFQKTMILEDPFTFTIYSPLDSRIPPDDFRLDDHPHDIPTQYGSHGFLRSISEMPISSSCGWTPRWGFNLVGSVGWGKGRLGVATLADVIIKCST